VLAYGQQETGSRILIDADWAVSLNILVF